MDDDGYRGLSCSAYDLLELWSLRKRKLQANWNGKTIIGFIENLVADRQGEWAIWSSGERTRLDHLKDIKEVE